MAQWFGEWGVVNFAGGWLCNACIKAFCYLTSVSGA